MTIRLSERFFLVTYPDVPLYRVETVILDSNAVSAIYDWAQGKTEPNSPDVIPMLDALRSVKHIELFYGAYESCWQFERGAPVSESNFNMVRIYDFKFKVLAIDSVTRADKKDFNEWISPSRRGSINFLPEVETRLKHFKPDDETFKSLAQASMQEWVLYLLLLKHLRPVWDSEDIQELMVGFKAWVDEWDEIDALVRSSSSRLIIFMDGNQAVYQVATDLATRLNAKSVTLRVNLRNTRLIARVVDKLYEGPRAQVAGPEGLAPQLMKVKNEQEAIEGISSKILNLHQLEGVKLGDIVVLSASKLFLRKLEALFRTMRLIYGSSTSRSGLSVTIDLIQAFKGLESSFVFLYADADAGNSRELSYVGTSRARTNLYVYSLSENSMIARSFLE